MLFDLMYPTTGSMITFKMNTLIGRIRNKISRLHMLQIYYQPSLAQVAARYTIAQRERAASRSASGERI